MADLEQDPPFVPPTEIRVTDENGKQTTSLHDWFTGLFGWMRANVVDLRTKVTTLIDGQDDLQAALEVEQIARVDGDTALAASITTVDAKANNATANGQIFLAAKAAPSGSTAAYGIYLTAGSKFTGLEMLATSGGDSAIGMTASKFTFTDSGTSQAVFGYTGSAFVFQVPVVLQSGGTGQPSSKILIYDASNVLRVAIGVGI